MSQSVPISIIHARTCLASSIGAISVHSSVSGLYTSQLFVGCRSSHAPPSTAKHTAQANHTQSERTVEEAIDHTRTAALSPVDHTVRSAPRVGRYIVPLHCVQRELAAHHVAPACAGTAPSAAQLCWRGISSSQCRFRCDIRRTKGWANDKADKTAAAQQRVTAAAPTRLECSPSLI